MSFEIPLKSDKGKLAKQMNKMRHFLEKLADDNSDFHKAVKGAKKGMEMAQKVGKTYNKFAQLLALPQASDLFIGKKNRREEMKMQRRNSIHLLFTIFD